MLLDGIVGLGGVISKPYRGALKHGPRGFAKGLVQGALCVLRPPIGVLDLLTKTVEGLIHSPFLGVRRHLRQPLPAARAAGGAADGASPRPPPAVNRQQQPFALHANRLVAPFNAEESRAYELLSLCSPAAPARGGRGGRAEFFQAQHPIEYRDGMRLEQRVALSPRRVRVDQWFDGRCNRTERLLGARHHAARRLRPPRAARGGGCPREFRPLTGGLWMAGVGCLDPLELLFEVPLERMARVDLQEPFTHIILWTWTEVRVLRRAGLNAIPNMVLERHIKGSRPSQLRAAKEHLLLLANQEEVPAAVAEQMAPLRV